MTRLLLPKPKREAKPPRRIPRGKRPRSRRKGGKAWAARECDRLWGLLTRARNDGVCWLLGRVDGHTCKGPIQAAHGISRRYRATRWSLLNGFPLCAGGHVKYTYDPVTWDWWLLQWWGSDLFWALRTVAREGKKRDQREVLENLRAEAKKLGLEAA